jgi:hypothetical protein
MHACQLDSYEILEYEFEMKRSLGRPRKKWRDRIRKKVCEREKGSTGHRKKKRLLGRPRIK